MTDNVRKLESEHTGDIQTIPVVTLVVERILNLIDN